MIAALLVALITAGPSGSGDPAARASPPPSMQGVWARRGRCDLASERFTVTARAAGWGRARLDPIHYDPEETAIEWDEEGVVDNFVLAPRGDVLVHNIEGFGMPEREALARCGPAMKRVAWPMKGIAP